MTAIRVVFAENLPVDYSGIEKILSEASGIKVERGVTDADALLSAVSELRPNVVVTDIKMGPKHLDDGIKAALKIREIDPRIGVVVLSAYDNPKYADKLFSGGAAGIAFLDKFRMREAKVLVNAVREVFEGRTVIDAVIVEKWSSMKRKMADSRIDALTQKELRVLEFVAQGKNNRQIAGLIVDSDQNVEQIVHRVYEKLGIERGDGSQRVLAAVRYLTTFAERSDSDAPS